MAVAYQSIQTASVVSPSGSLTITKPVSLAVGDLMIAGIAGLTGTNSPPSGWTAIRNQTANSVITSCYWKIATSSDVAASNFTFTNSANRGMIGFIQQWTGTDQTAPIDQNNGVEQTGASTTLTITGGITPTKANSVFVLVPSWFRDGANVTLSTYAVATNNPTWTEVTDAAFTAESTFHIGIASAYGGRPETTASGNATAVTSGTTDNGKMMMFNIVPPQTVLSDNFMMGANF